MAKRGRKAKQPYVKMWSVLLYKPHSSGIGSTYIKTIDVTERPSFENGYWFDETNRMWVLWEKDYNKRQLVTD